MGLLSSILSGLTAKNGMDQGIIKALPNAGMDSGILKGVGNAFMPGAAAQMPELRDNAQTMLGALLQKDAGGQRHLLSNLGGMLKNPEALKYIGAAIKDMSGEDGNLQAAEQNVLAKQEQAKREAASLQSRQAINLALQNAYGDDGKFDPMAFAQGMIGSGTLTDAGDILGFAKEATPAPVKPQYIEGPDGIYEIMGGNSRKVQEYPQQQPNAPAGYAWAAPGQLQYIPGGPGDPRVISGRAAAGRAPPRPRQATGPMAGIKWD